MLQNLDLFESLESPKVNTDTPWKAFIDTASRLQKDAVESIINSNGKRIPRNTSVGDTVDAYRNLNKPEFFSCKQTKGENKGKVSCYAKVIVLGDVCFKVSEASRQRILKQQSRNVHAFVRGEFLDCFDGKFTPDDSFICTTYNPYKGDWFYIRESGEPIPRNTTSRFAILHGSNVYLSNI